MKKYFKRDSKVLVILQEEGNAIFPVPGDPDEGRNCINWRRQQGEC